MVTLGNGATAAVQAQICEPRHQRAHDPPGPGLRPRRRRPAAARFDDADVERDPRPDRRRRARSRRRTRSSVTVVLQRRRTGRRRCIGTTNDYFAASGIRLDVGPHRSPRPRSQAGQGGLRHRRDRSRPNLFRGRRSGRPALPPQATSRCQVIGVLARRGQGGFGQDQDDRSSCRSRRCSAASPATATSARSWSPSTDGLFDARRSARTSIRAAARAPPHRRRASDDNFNIFDPSRSPTRCRAPRRR